MHDEETQEKLNAESKFIANYYTDKHGDWYQQVKMFEELGELLTATARNMLKPSEEGRLQVSSEMADVKIMIRQGAYILNIEKKVDEDEIFKSGRQIIRIADGDE